MVTEYYYADPTGNITLLAPLPRDGTSLQQTSKILMQLEPSAEQVGFLSKGDNDCDITLQMAGGEFCGNAALSAAAVYSLNTHFSQLHTEKQICVRVSGTATPVAVFLQKTGNNSFYGKVFMPAPLSISLHQLPLNDQMVVFPVVTFSGITHVVSEQSLPKEALELAIKKWCFSLHAEALGIMQLNAEKKTLLPLVYVRNGETLFWESSCASGTTAVGAYLREKYGPGCWEFSEPAGKLKILADAQGNLVLSAPVTVEKRTI